MSGAICFASADAHIISLMRGILNGSVSIVSLLTVSLLPFLFSAFAVFISQLWLLYLIGFVRSFLFSFVSFGITVAFGSAGWLFRLLLMLGDCVTAPLLYLYMYRHLSSDSRFSAAEILRMIAITIFIGSIDYCYILPFVADMINS